MPFNLALLKEHPYATGGVVIVGGLIVFYLLSSGSSSGTATVSGSDSATLAADEQLAQVQAAAQVQTNATQAQLQQAQLEQQTTEYTTDAAVHANDVSTAAALTTSLAQTQAEYLLGLDTNATTVSTSQMQADVLSQEIDAAQRANDEAYALANTKETDFESNVQTIIPLAGKQYNSALDANNANAEFQTILAGGQPSVAATGTTSSSTVAGTSSSQSASALKSITSGITSIFNGLLG